MRGKVDPQNGQRFSLRITPAYAGKSHIISGLLPITWDHPRLCGEKN